MLAFLRRAAWPTGKQASTIWYNTSFWKHKWKFDFGFLIGI